MDKGVHVVNALSRISWFVALLVAVTVGASFVGLDLVAQTPGPIQGPKRPPKPSAKTPDANPDAPAAEPAELPKIETRSRLPVPEDTPLFRTDTNYVTVEISVLDDNGVFIPGIPAGNFQILEDGVPQKIVELGQSEAPMTVCLLVEFSNLYQQYWSESWYQTLQAAYGFVDTLGPQDWVAVVAYDLRPEILADFTQNKQTVMEAMQRMRIAGYSESNLFDALAEMCERMKDIEGRKSIVVISSGVDTFSKRTFKQAREIIQDAGVTIHAIGLMQALRQWYDARGYMGSIQRMDFLQADNQMRTFAKETGGLSFFPRFYGEFPGIFRALNYVMRNQYVAVYQPSNTQRDGSYRKIEVRLVDPNTNKDLRITGKKDKRIKYQIVHKEGYYAPREVE
ncbi:MAG: VWA domain-containing protein [Acidobacteria bacterium]|nr:VWA domain-containing protein [Acidobacteriota bacterium]